MFFCSDTGIGCTTTMSHTHETSPSCALRFFLCTLHFVLILQCKVHETELSVSSQPLSLIITSTPSSVLTCTLYVVTNHTFSHRTYLMCLLHCMLDRIIKDMNFYLLWFRETVSKNQTQNLKSKPTDKIMTQRG